MPILKRSEIDIQTKMQSRRLHFNLRECAKYKNHQIFMSKTKVSQFDIFLSH